MCLADTETPNMFRNLNLVSHQAVLISQHILSLEIPGAYGLAEDPLCAESGLSDRGLVRVSRGEQTYTPAWMDGVKGLL